MLGSVHITVCMDTDKSGFAWEKQLKITLKAIDDNNKDAVLTLSVREDLSVHGAG